jgi:hypothetical protein
MRFVLEEFVRMTPFRTGMNCAASDTCLMTGRGSGPNIHPSLSKPVEPGIPGYSKPQPGGHPFKATGNK